MNLRLILLSGCPDFCSKHSICNSIQHGLLTEDIPQYEEKWQYHRTENSAWYKENSEIERG